MTRRILRYEVPIDDRRHTVELKAGAAVVLVAASARHIDRVEFWAEGELDDRTAQPIGPLEARTFEVFGTGHSLPDDAVWRGTTGRTPEGLVWHLMELPGGAS